MNNIEILKAMVVGRTISHAKDPDAHYRLDRLVQVDTKDGWKDGLMYTRVNGGDGTMYVRPIDGFVNFKVVDPMEAMRPRAPVPAYGRQMPHIPEF